MRTFVFILILLKFNPIAAQLISDSLSYENIKAKFLTDLNFYTSTDSANDRIYMYESEGLSEISDIKNALPKRSGDYFEYDLNKKLIVYGNFSKDEAHGLFLYFGGNQKVERSTHFKKGKMSGPAKSYYSNGQLRLSTDYKGGLKDGEILGFYIDGNRLFTGKYKKDRMIGQRMYYDVKGRPANGEMSWRHENGVIKLKGKCKNGLPDGVFEHFNEEGDLILRVSYVKGLPHGAYIVYESNKEVKREYYEYGRFVKNQCQ